MMRPLTKKQSAQPRGGGGGAGCTLETRHQTLKSSQAAHLRAEATSLTFLGLYKARFAGGIVKCLESFPYTSLLADTVSPGGTIKPPHKSVLEGQCSKIISHRELWH